MNDLEFCVARRKAEKAAFVRVLKALPQGRLDYRPDPRSRSAAEIAWLIAAEEGSIVPLLDSGAIDWKEEKPPASVDEIVAAYERNCAAVDGRLAKIDEAAWRKPGRFLWEGTVAWEDSVGQMVWGMLFDAIHHRGQLSAYLRPMGAKVPSIYGPSGDDPGQ